MFEFKRTKQIEHSSDKETRQNQCQKWITKKLNRLKLSINDKNIVDNLYTRNIPDPEILIRTGDRKRLSNFLLWQSSYTEIYFEKKLWPDFKANDFHKIISNFSKVRRNFGGIK